MIKKSSLKRIMLATLVLILLLIVYLFPKNNAISENLSYIKKEEMPIFLMDKLDYVARTTIIKDNDTTNELIDEIIDSLTINSKKSNYIKEGFRAIIPENTKIIDKKLENGLLTINFSKELLTVSKENEEKMLEAIIYSLLEIKDIKGITIMVEGSFLKELPNSHKKIPNVLDKNYGINKIYDLYSLKNISKTTIYYLSKNNDYYYYVPVTKINNNENERIEIIINELKSTPIYHTNLISYLEASTNLTSYELLANSIELSFDNYLLANLHNKDLLEEVQYTIALSVRDTYEIYETIFNSPELNNIHLKI